MFGALLKNALDQISIVEILIVKHEEIIAAETPQVATGIKLYAASSCITRLYAIYEHFIQSIITDYLDAMPELIPYSDLSDVIKSEYRIGISHLLGKVGSGRYSGLSHENIILLYHEALTGKLKYQLVTQALTRHEQNLRLNVVETIIGRVELKDLRGWLSNSADLLKLYDGNISVIEQIEAEINELIQFRNEAAHGYLSVAFGQTILIRYCNLVKELLKTLTGYFHKHLLEVRVNANKSIKVGKVSEVFSQAGAFIIKLNDGCTLSVNTQIHLVNANFCTSQTIDSLKLNGWDISTITALKDELEIGVKCEHNSKRDADVYVDIS